MGTTACTNVRVSWDVTCAEDYRAMGLGLLGLGLPVAAHLSQVVAPAAAGLAERLRLARAIEACRN